MRVPVDGAFDWLFRGDPDASVADGRASFLSRRAVVVVVGIRVGVGGLLSPLGTPSSTGNPSESLVNTPPPLSPANLLPD